MPSVLGSNNLLRAFFFYPAFLFYIIKYLPWATHIHTRAPAHPALLGLVVSWLVRSKQFWHKYAGNWIQPNLALSYRLQRKLLQLSAGNSVVTVNGKWPANRQHVLAFENPCLSEHELQEASQLAATKDFSGQLDIIFVGNLVESKGILQLMDALKSDLLSLRYRNVFIVGNGTLKQQVEQKAAAIKYVNVQVMGALRRSQLNKLYSEAHIMILPSGNEGFPKVIAEAAAYGCVPVMTNVSAISQYISTNENGYLLDTNKAHNILNALNALADNKDIKNISTKANALASLFTYERFINRIKNEVFRF